MKSRIYVIIYLITVYFLSSSLFSIETKKDHLIKTSKKMLWEGKKIKINEIFRIGSDDYDEENYIFGSITDIAIDNIGNIYVLDSKNSRIQKYSGEGEYIQSIGKGRGAGPGELNRPKNISIDEHGNLFVADMNLLRITIFNSKGDVLNTIKTIIQPIDMVIGNNDEIYVTGSFDVGKYKIYKYNSSNGKLVKVFCEEVNKENDAILIANIGGTGRLSVSKEGYIYFSFFYPYLIRKYSQDGDLISQFSRIASFYKLPTIEKSGKIKDVLTGSHELTTLPDGKVLHVIKNIDFVNSKSILYFDLFDQNGNWLTSFPSTVFDPNWTGKVLSVDLEGYLYMDFWDPFPHVIKFELVLPKD